MNELYPPTPGPWFLASNGKNTKIVDAKEKAVCMVTARRDAWNGHVLAAVPDLLAALEAMVDDFESLMDEAIYQGADVLWESRAKVKLANAHAAIARARGKA